MRREESEVKEFRRENTFDKELDAAFEELHRKYGNDFQAFLRDVQESMRRQRASHNQNIGDPCLL
jgi:hypothetical protein